MKPEWKKDWAMEVEFDDLGCTLTLFSNDIFHYSKFKLTFEELSEWKNSDKFPGDIAWLRSEFVRQVLEETERAEAMPCSGLRKWSNVDNWMKDVPLWDYINDLGEIN
jgi:hypothetical protein